jgi:hypothetical protein
MQFYLILPSDRQRMQVPESLRNFCDYRGNNIQYQQSLKPAKMNNHTPIQLTSYDLFHHFNSRLNAWECRMYILLRFNNFLLLYFYVFHDYSFIIS